jgi:two-component system, OmpR family, sensor kinase
VSSSTPTREGQDLALKAGQSTQQALPRVAGLPGKQRLGEGGRWLGAARSARAKILASYVALLALTAVLSMFVLHELLVVRLDDRVEESLEQEVLELDRLVAVGRDPETGEPFTSPQALFDAYLARNVPGPEEALLAFVDGRFYRSALARFPLDQLPAEQLADWEALASPSPGEGQSASGRMDTELGEAHFRVRRVLLEEGTGALVVTILPAGELDEIGKLQTYGVVTAFGLLLMATAVAWFITGRVLAPVRLLTDTARSISLSELTRRIEVRGTGDAAEMARSFNAMLDRLEAVFRSQREFVRDASHELRDPLTICHGHLELLGEDPEDQRRTIGLVMDELERMARIVNELQLLAEAEQPDFLQREWMDVGLFAHELTAKAGALAPRDWRLDRAAEGMMFADRQRLTEAVMNLAHNAVQHTLADDTVAIGTSLSDSEVRIWVRDTGTGISVSDQALIFERFRRGSGAHLRYRGGGLGLAIVKAIAETHGGRVELESRLGEGSTFTIVLPRRRQPSEGAANGQNPDR